MRVLWVTNAWPDEVRPAYGTFVRRQADALGRLGVDIDVLYIKGYVARGAYAGAALRMSRLNAATRGYDLVHAHNGHSAAVARSQLRLPLVVAYYGSDLLGSRGPDGAITRKTRAEMTVFRQLARAAAATMTQSRQMEAALPAACRARNHVVPTGIDLERFAPIDRAEARRRLGWARDGKVVLFAANPGLGTKNFTLAEEVAARVAGGNGGVTLKVAWGVRPDEVPVWMSAADALLLTSHSEGSPNVVKEAMALELPVVATAVGDVPERLAGVPGCHAGRPDAGELAAALEAALEHGRVPEARAAVAALDGPVIAGRVRDVYASVLT